MLEKQEKRKRRHKRIRAKIKGNERIPRLCVFKSGKYIYAQLINDDKNIVMAQVSDRKLKAVHKEKEDKKTTHKVARAHEVGRILAKLALENNIEKVVFDRSGYKYHGRIKSLAEGAREAGLKF
jgi:large subunit ribosomal protein L18